MKVFITGATGFIGSHLVSRLLKEGYELRCLVRNPDRAVELQRPGVELVIGDVNDQAVLREGMRDCDWLFHLANLYSMWEVDKTCFHTVNVAGTRRVLETALECGLKKVVYVSTVAVYGKPQHAPFTEDSTPGLQLYSEYARTKAAGNQIAWELYQTHGLPLVVLFPGIVLGAGDKKASGQYIQDILRRRVPSTIFHKSRSIYVYVEDVVDALLRAAELPEAVGQKYLIGGYGLSGEAFARLISRISKVPLPLLHFPDSVVIGAAYLLTALATLTRRAPWWGLSVDAAWTLKHGFDFDGSKAVRELGLTYTPLEQAVAEAAQSYAPAATVAQPFLLSSWRAALLRVFDKE